MGGGSTRGVKKRGGKGRWRKPERSRDFDAASAQTLSRRTPTEPHLFPREIKTRDDAERMTSPGPNKTALVLFEKTGPGAGRGIRGSRRATVWLGLTRIIDARDGHVLFFVCCSRAKDFSRLQPGVARHEPPVGAPTPPHPTPPHPTPPHCHIRNRPGSPGSRARAETPLHPFSPPAPSGKRHPLNACGECVGSFPRRKIAADSSLNGSGNPSPPSRQDSAVSPTLHLPSTGTPRKTRARKSGPAFQIFATFPTGALRSLRSLRSLRFPGAVPGKIPAESSGAGLGEDRGASGGVHAFGAFLWVLLVHHFLHAPASSP